MVEYINRQDTDRYLCKPHHYVLTDMPPANGSEKAMSCILLSAPCLKLLRVFSIDFNSNECLAIHSAAVGINYVVCLFKSQDVT